MHVCCLQTIHFLVRKSYWQPKSTNMSIYLSRSLALSRSRSTIKLFKSTKFKETEKKLIYKIRLSKQTISRRETKRKYGVYKVGASKGRNFSQTLTITLS